MSGKGSQPKDKQDAFFQAAAAARRNSRDEIQALIREGNYWMHNGVFFEVTDTFAKTLNALVASVVKTHGASKVNKKQIQQIALDVALDASLNKAKTFEAAVASEVTKQYERIEPCFAVVLNKVKRLQVGSVTFELANEVARQLNGKDRPWKIAPGVPPSSTIDGNTFVIGMPQLVSRVQLKCFKGNVRDEAAWHVDIALSLLRLLIPANRRASHFPSLGGVEASAAGPPNRDNYGITLHGTITSFGGASLDGWYEITSKTFSARKRTWLATLGTGVMQPNKGSVAARIGNGLGWLSRGRRANDQAERFLHFFTAIESLLTREDKTAPVTDTICRSVACILAKKIRDRPPIAKTMSDLYTTRSALVHAGDRRVSEAESTQLQLHAELVFLRVIENIPLTMGLQEFHSKLKIASYGNKWP